MSLAVLEKETEMKGKFWIITALVGLIGIASADAHSGGTDASGGHYDTASGKYHYHVNPNAATVKEVEVDPVIAERDILKAAADAERDVAQLDTSYWAIGGCLFGIIGVAYASAYNHTPPMAKLIGKSPEYIQAYLHAYHNLAQKRMTNAAMQGCVVGTVLSVGVLLYSEDGNY